MAANDRTESARPPAPADSESADPDSVIAPEAALARFEFETSKGNEGTKILMVEWDPSSAGSDPSKSDWEISWEGKKTVLRTTEQGLDSRKRVYFLLPPGAAVPPLVTISKPHGPRLETKPLPAIFAPGLGVSLGDVGPRGVLHTIWAKKRLLELEEEIGTEMRTNLEGVGLQMALQEKQWIQNHFGVDEAGSPSHSSPIPMSPRSPAGGRLGEKLRGLKLATSPIDLVPSPISQGMPNSHLQSLSPVAGDIAVSSFSSFHGRSAPNAPSTNGGAASLDSALHSGVVNGDPAESEGLFALPLSPRSPEMKKSPFSLL